MKVSDFLLQYSWSNTKNLLFELCEKNNIPLFSIWTIFFAQENDDVVTIENNWQVREHARMHWRDSASNLPYYIVIVNLWILTCTFCFRKHITQQSVLVCSHLVDLSKVVSGDILTYVFRFRYIMSFHAFNLLQHFVQDGPQEKKLTWGYL